MTQQLNRLARILVQLSGVGRPNFAVPGKSAGNPFTADEVVCSVVSDAVEGLSDTEVVSLLSAELEHTITATRIWTDAWGSDLLYKSVDPRKCLCSVLLRMVWRVVWNIPLPA